MFIISNVVVYESKMSIATSTFQNIEIFVGALLDWAPIQSHFRINPVTTLSSSVENYIKKIHSSAIYVDEIGNECDFSNPFINKYNSRCEKNLSIVLWASEKNATVVNAVSEAMRAELQQLVIESLSSLGIKIS